MNTKRVMMMRGNSIKLVMLAFLLCFQSVRAMDHQKPSVATDERAASDGNDLVGDDVTPRVSRSYATTTDMPEDMNMEAGVKLPQKPGLNLERLLSNVRTSEHEEPSATQTNAEQPAPIKEETQSNESVPSNGQREQLRKALEQLRANEGVLNSTSAVPRSSRSQSEPIKSQAPTVTEQILKQQIPGLTAAVSGDELEAGEGEHEEDRLRSFIRKVGEEERKKKAAAQKKANDLQDVLGRLNECAVPKKTKNEQKQYSEKVQQQLTLEAFMDEKLEAGEGELQVEDNLKQPKGLLKAATCGIFGVSFLTYNISSMLSDWASLFDADPMFYITLGIGAVFLFVGIFLASIHNGGNRNYMTAFVLTTMLGTSAISLITIGAFQQAVPTSDTLVDTLVGPMELYLIIGAGMFLLTVIVAGSALCATQPKQSAKFLPAVVVGSLLTLLVGGSATTIALSPALLTGNTVYAAMGVGGFVLLAIFIMAYKSCTTYAGGNGMVAKKGAKVFAAWAAIITVAGASAAMICGSTMGQTGNLGQIFANPVFIVGATVAVLVAVGLLVGGSCCRKENTKCGNLFFK